MNLFTTKIIFKLVGSLRSSCQLLVQVTALSILHSCSSLHLGFLFGLLTTFHAHPCTFSNYRRLNESTGGRRNFLDSNLIENPLLLAPVFNSS